MSRPHKYTEEHIEFLREYSPTHTIEQTWEAFFDKFEMDINISSITYLVNKYNIPHVTRYDIHPKDIKSRGGRGTRKTKFRRTKIRGTEDVCNIINDISDLDNCRKYEVCHNAIKYFLKSGDKVSTKLKNGRYIKNPRYVNVEIPLRLEDKINEVAKENECSVNTVMFQALVNYGVDRIPSKEDDLKKIATNGKKLQSTKKKDDSDRHQWNEEEVEYIRTLAPDHTYGEVVQMFNEKFSTNVTYSMVQRYMYRHGIKIGKKNHRGRKPKNKSADKDNKYYVNGMEELAVTPVSKEAEAVPIPVEIPEVEVVPVPAAVPNKVSVEHAKADTEEQQDTVTPQTKIDKQSKKYIIPKDIPKIIEKVKKLTAASRYEFNNCAIKYYLSKQTHIDKRLKTEKYESSMWLNTTFTQPVIISLDYINNLQLVAQNFNCTVSDILIQAYIDYSSKIFEDFGIDCKYIFETDLKDDNEH